MSKLKQFNTPDTVLVLASYPDYEAGKKSKETLNAMAFHSEHILKEIGKNRKIVIFAEEDGGKKEFMVGENILVKRVWKKGSLLSFIQLARLIMQQDKITSILIQFEFHVFGGTIANLYLLALMLCMRGLGKKITFECHQVILNIKLLQKHINITNPLLQLFYNISLRIYYMILGLLANNIIVFEEELKRRLSSYVQKNKIYTLSLFVEKKKVLQQKQARKLVNKTLVYKKNKLKNDEFVVLVFGFINGYKGIDWVIEKLEKEGKKKIRLLVVGGKNPYLTGKPAYERFYNSIVSSIKKHKHMSYVDFVPEKDIPLYYSAADVALIPYEVFMSASGPFSQVLSCGKPVLLSEHVASYTNSYDIKATMQEVGITKEDLIFQYNKKDFMRLINTARTNPEAYSKLQQFSKRLAEKRSIGQIARLEDNILFPALYASHKQATIPSIISA